MPNSEEKKKKWFKWMKAYKVERGRRNSIVALSAEFEGLEQMVHNDTSHGGPKDLASSDWAHKGNQEGFLEEVVEDALKIDSNRGKAKKIVDDMVVKLTAAAAQAEGGDTATAQLRHITQAQSVISLILATAIIFMQATGSAVLVVDRSIVSTLLVVIAGFAIVAAAGACIVNRSFPSRSGGPVGRQLAALLDSALAAVTLLREAGSVGTKIECDSVAGGDLMNANMLPKEQFGEPPADLFTVRSGSYLTDKKKVKSSPAMFKLLAVDLVETSHNMQNIACHPRNRVALAKARGDSKDAFTLILNFMIPGPPCLSYSAYWDVDVGLVHAETPFGRVAKPFFFGESDEYRDNRFKFIPKVCYDLFCSVQFCSVLFCSVLFCYCVHVYI
jgi:hypothetical protein